uniref:Uncharacterized protein n=1 Tax=Lotus japonicus TaxID=34305 RepID=I3SXM6_LOTJA|nr:unknown [Lotus japonicus]
MSHHQMLVKQTNNDTTELHKHKTNPYIHIKYTTMSSFIYHTSLIRESLAAVGSRIISRNLCSYSAPPASSSSIFHFHSPAPLAW